MEHLSFKANELLIASLRPATRRVIACCLRAGASIPEVEYHFRAAGAGPLLRMAAVAYCEKWLKRWAIAICKKE